jgi:hypothetical protein
MAGFQSLTASQRSQLMARMGVPQSFSIAKLTLRRFPTMGAASRRRRLPQMEYGRAHHDRLILEVTG